MAAVAGSDLLAAEILERGAERPGESWYEADVAYAVELAGLVGELADRMGAVAIVVGAPADSGAASRVQRASAAGVLGMVAEMAGRRFVVVHGDYGGVSPAVLVGCGASFAKPAQFVARAAYEVARAGAGALGHRGWTPRVVEGAQRP